MNRMIAGTIKKLFPNDFEELQPVKRHWWQKIDVSNLKKKEAIWAVLAIAVVVLPAIYYFNQFIVLETNAATARAQVDVQLQRRKDLLINLTTTLIDYAQHERVMFQYMADRRTGPAKNPEALMAELKNSGLMDMVKAGGAKVPAGALSKLIALAEAYPELKLSANFQKMMDALIATEDKIAEKRMAYNDQGNIFGTYVRQFPQWIYAFVFRYSDKMFPYIAVDKDVGEYNRIKY